MDQTGSAVSHTSNKSEFLVSGKYRLVRKIGSGSFGDIYLGINVTNGEVRSRPSDDNNATRETKRVLF